MGSFPSDRREKRLSGASRLMFSRISASPLTALCLLSLALCAPAQNLGFGGDDLIPISAVGFDPMADDRTVGLMAEANTVFEIVDDNAYIVGPGDILYVSMGVRGYKILVSPDGAAIIDAYPPVKVSGKTLAETRKVLTQTYQRYYKGGPIQVALAQAKRFQVSVTGAVNASGMHVVGAGSRLSQVIRIAGNFSRQASSRAVIRDAAGKETRVDLGAYYRDGDLSQNPYVQQGDHIFLEEIDYAQPMVYVQSERGTRTVQIAQGDDVQAIVARSVDFENAPSWDHLNVFKDGKLLKRVERSEASKYTPPAGSTIEVRTTQMLVFVGGAVLAPNAYPYNPTFTILDYLSRAGITYNSASAKDVTVIDAKGDVRKVKANKESPRPGDHILLPRSVEAKTRDW